MISNYTPGPWKLLPIGESKYYGTEVDLGDYCTVVVWGSDDDTPSEREIALGWDDDCGMDHVEKCKDLANARLIAAAPDLLEDLESRYYETLCGCGHPACKSCRGDKETAKLLARAKGKVEE